MLLGSHNVLLVLLSLFGAMLLSLFAVSGLRLKSRVALLLRSLANANREINRLTLHDPLTHLPNRLLFDDLLGQTLRNERHKPARLALLSMDLDGFKSVNEAYGHHIGDQLLAEAALRLREQVPMQDILARVGGDKFMAMAAVREVDDAVRLATHLVDNLRDPFMVEDYELQITASIGVAVYPEHGETSEAMVANAEAAMYHAKSKGRDMVSVFEESMNAAMQEQLQLLQELRYALERREFILHYQPKFDAPDGPIVGVEALLRWVHPDMGMVPPDKFIPLAEKLGLILPIGDWVLDEACRQMAQWNHAGHARDWTMAVNLSALQFNHASLTQRVRDALQRNALRPQSLVLEITETTAMRDIQVSTRVLQQLHEMGVGISIDDFGTGYSSLLYLKRFPASELKIDRGFIRDLAQDTEDAAIVSAIIALGRTLDMKIVAEGVETRAQQSFLTRIGCNSLQGFLLARPMPAEQLQSTLMPA